MKKLIIISLAGMIGLSSTCDRKKENAPTFNELKTESDSLSYFLGADLGGKFLSSNIDKVFEETSFLKGIEDGIAGSGVIVEGKDIQELLISKFQSLNGDTTTNVFVGKAVTAFDGLKSFNDTISYVIGTDVASGITSNGFDKYFSENAYLQGINDKMSNQPLKIDEQKMQAKAQTIVQAQGLIKAKSGEDFLIAKSAEENVVTLPSGLRYKILTKGTGAKPTATDVVSTHYHGTLIDGTVFDSSVERGTPAEFPVNRVIPGWTEALQLMPVGSKWELYVPYNLAYGERGNQGIAPYSTLIFEVELLKIMPATPQGAPQF